MIVIVFYFNLIFGYKLVISIYVFFVHGEIKLTYLNGILPVNIATVIAIRSLLFKGQTNGRDKRFYEEELPSSTFRYFQCLAKQSTIKINW